MTPSPRFDLHPEVAGDITRIWEYIAADSPAAAGRVRQALLEAFRRIALALDAAEVAELRTSLKDRYGKLPPEADALLSLAEIRCLAEDKGVVSVTTDGAVIRCLSATGGRAPEPILVGNRFPRLTVRDPLRKLKEIRGFLSRLPAPDVR